MKALIVDDEKPVREAIQLLVPWSNYGIDRVLEASDGRQAMELVETERPEIIFTDMIMPIANGVALLQWLHSHAPESKTVVISGHDDYDFIRQTVKYNGIDYILKPIDAEELKEALRKAICSWEEEETERIQNHQRNIEMNQIKPIYWDKILSNLIANPAYFHSMRNSLANEFPLAANAQKGRILILNLEAIDQTIVEKFSSNRDLLWFSMTNICNEFIHSANIGHCFRYWNHNEQIILLIWEDVKHLEQLIKEINDGLYGVLEGWFHFGVGSLVPFPEGLSRSYEEAKLSLRQRNLLHDDTWIHYYHARTQQSPAGAFHFSQSEEDIRLAVQSGSAKQIDRVANSLMNQLKNCSVLTHEQLKQWNNEFNATKSYWQSEWIMEENDVEMSYPIRNESSIPLDRHGKLSLTRWKDELKESLQHLSRLYLDKQQRKDNTIIYEIKKYIESNYHREITLQDIANQYYLSREYISRKFKLEMKENLSDYLGRIRVEKAQILLLNPHLKISQIADMVGYRDEKYFSKVFKKMSGITPNEYRKQNNPPHRYRHFT